MEHVFHCLSHLLTRRRTGIFRGHLLEPSMNNVVEYIIFIEILSNTILHGAQSLKVLFESMLVICQLNNSYHV